MARPLFARGAKGALVATLQDPILPPELPRGFYGPQTVAAVRDFQIRNRLQPTGAVDSDLWTSITRLPVPSTFDRCLEVTAAMEGHGYTLAEGNFDGQGITWGIVGFTLQNGEIATLVREIDGRQPGLVDESFGSLARDLRRLLAMSPIDAVAFCNTITDGEKLRADWRTAFARLGSNRDVQDVQLARAKNVYGAAALDVVREFNLKTELSFALAFDIVVQITFDARARQPIHRQLAQHPVTRESEVRAIIAHAVADRAKKVSQQDVLARKMTFATGAGVVHGETYVLANWGLGDFPM